VINSVEAYLARLKEEMQGCDTATIRDALSDAEEHLRSAMETQEDGQESQTLQQIMAEYGSPEETAEAYRSLEKRFSPTLQPSNGRYRRPFLARFFGVFGEPRAWGALLYMLLALVTGTVYFSWGVTGLSVSIGMSILIFGLPLAALFMLSFRGIALLEGRIVEALLGVRMPRRPVFYRKDLTLWEKFKSLVSSKHTWLSLAYMILQLPLGVFYFCLFVTLISLSLALIAIPVLQYGFELPFTLASGRYFLMDWAMPLVVIGGILLLTLTMHLAKWIGFLHGRLAKSLLVSE
jgi:hypothetical protein